MALMEPPRLLYTQQNNQTLINQLIRHSVKNGFFDIVKHVDAGRILEGELPPCGLAVGK